MKKVGITHLFHYPGHASDQAMESFTSTFPRTAAE